MTTQYTNKQLREIAIKAKEHQDRMYIKSRVQYITNLIIKSAEDGDMKCDAYELKCYAPQIIADVKKNIS